MPSHSCANKTIVVIANPTAGRHARKRKTEAVEALGAAGAKVVVPETSCPGEATPLAREAAAGHPHCVAAAGGDGTINEVANGLVRTSTPLGVLPMGTANLLARELNVNGRLAKAVELLLEGSPRPASAGRIGNSYFLLMAGVGFDGEVVHRVRPALKKVLGPVAYVVAGIRALRAWPVPELTITLDDDIRLSGCHTVIGKGNYYGGPFHVTPGVHVTDPAFEVAVFRGASRHELLADALRIGLGRHARSRNLVLRKAHRVSVTAVQPAHVQIDGDAFGTLPLYAEVAADVLRIMHPPR